MEIRSIYRCDFNKLAYFRTRVNKRGFEFLALVKALVVPLTSFRNLLQTFVKDVDYKLTHNSQVVYLRAAINDAVDPDLRRITIEDAEAGEAFVTKLQLDILEEPVIPPVILQRNSYYANSGFDFRVIVPFNYTDEQYYKIVSTVEYYKLAGKRYEIIKSV